MCKYLRDSATIAARQPTGAITPTWHSTNKKWRRPGWDNFQKIELVNKRLTGAKTGPVQVFTLKERAIKTG